MDVLIVVVIVVSIAELIGQRHLTATPRSLFQFHLSSAVGDHYTGEVATEISVV